QQQPQQDRRVEGDGGNEASQARPRDLLERLHAGLRMLCLRISAKRITASTTSSSVASSSTSTPERSNALRKAVSRASAAAAKRARKLLAWVSTNTCSPVSVSWKVRNPRSGRRLSRGSVSR